MASELSDKFSHPEAGEIRTGPVPEDIVQSAGVRADVFLSAEPVRKAYDYYVGLLRGYDSGKFAIDPLKANRIRSNTRTVARILERIEEEDYETAQGRLRRAEILMQELRQKDSKLEKDSQKEGIEEFIVYSRPNGEIN